MGLFRMFAGKTPEAHEQKGDAYIQQRAFGDARLEFEKALAKVAKHFPEKSHLTDRLTEKLRSAAESLAMDHIENADVMAEAGDLAEAAELYGLAFDLTEQESTRRTVKSRMTELRRKSAGGDAGTVEEIDAAQWEPEAEPDEDTGVMDADEEEIFSVLCNALPEELADMYAGYGAAFKRGYIALNNGDFASATLELRQAMAENESRITKIPLELATAYMHLERHDTAREILESYIRENPEEVRAYQLLCEMYWESGEASRAAALIGSAPKQTRDLPAMRLLLGETRFQERRFDAALSIFTEYNDTYGRDEIVLRALAKTHEAAGRIENARDLYAEMMNKCVSCRKAIDPLIKRRFAELSFQSGEVSPKLLEVFFSLVKEDPEHRGVYYERIGSIYEKRGEHKEAHRYMNLAGQVK